MISQKEIQDLFDYRDGHLYWRKSGKGRNFDVPAGCVWAGKTKNAPRRMVCISGKRYMHYRLVWIWHYGEFDEELQIDHRDHNTLNDRIENLRLATPKQQLHNRRIGRFKRVHDLPKGVHKIAGRRTNPFMAMINVDGKTKYIGSYPTPEEAHARYCEVASKLHGEFFKGGGSQ